MGVLSADVYLKPQVFLFSLPFLQHLYLFLEIKLFFSLIFFCPF